MLLSTLGVCRKAGRCRTVCGGGLTSWSIWLGYVDTTVYLKPTDMYNNSVSYCNPSNPLEDLSIAYSSRIDYISIHGCCRLGH